LLALDGRRNIYTVRYHLEGELRMQRSQQFRFAVACDEHPRKRRAAVLQNQLVARASFLFQPAAAPFISGVSGRPGLRKK
jgi:hypothetical protein